MRRGLGNREPRHRRAADDIAESERQSRRDEAWRLRVTEGLSESKIAARLGVTQVTISRDLAKSREEHKPADLEELQAFVREELRSAIAGLRAAVTQGDPASVNAQVKALDSFCKLHGLYAPEKKEVSVSAGVTPAVAKRKMEEAFGRFTEATGDVPDVSGAPGEPPTE